MNTNHQTLATVSSAKADAIVASLRACEDLIRIWGSAHLGLVLAHAYFTGDFLTSQVLAERLGVSDETVRRQLRPLINIDRVRVIKEGRSVRYKAREEWANRTAERMLDGVDWVDERKALTPRVIPLHKVLCTSEHKFT